MILDLNLTVYPQLISLNITYCTLEFQDLKSLLSLTPSLVHLQLFAVRSVFDSILNGIYWEQFIQDKLFSLEEFQFCFQCQFKDYTDAIRIDSLILPFQTPFWLDKKHWFVTCDYVPKDIFIQIYTKSLHDTVYHAPETTFQVSSKNPLCRIFFRSWEHMDNDLEEDCKVSF